jgi:hypothetical protein
MSGWRKLFYLISIGINRTSFAKVRPDARSEIEGWNFVAENTHLLGQNLVSRFFPNTRRSEQISERGKDRILSESDRLLMVHISPEAK